MRMGCMYAHVLRIRLGARLYIYYALLLTAMNCVPRDNPECARPARGSQPVLTASAVSLSTV